MRALGTEELLRAWETGAVRPPTERALAVLAAAGVGPPPDELEAMPISHRDALLLAVREATFGRRYRALANCPACGDCLEVEFDGSAIGREPRSPAVSTLSVGGYTLEVRPIHTGDLTAAARCRDVPTARRVLAARAVVAALREGVPVEPNALPDDVIPEIADHLERTDPDSDTLLDVTCATCGLRWESTLDIAAYVWKEMEAEALRLLRDVHRLARACGWREADILSLSPLRRRAYLELVEP